MDSFLTASLKCLSAQGCPRLPASLCKHHSTASSALDAPCPAPPSVASWLRVPQRTAFLVVNHRAGPGFLDVGGGEDATSSRKRCTVAAAHQNGSCGGVWGAVEQGATSGLFTMSSATVPVPGFFFFNGMKQTRVPCPYKGTVGVWVI